MTTLLHRLRLWAARVRSHLASAADRDAAYLAEAVDAADLERRLRTIDERGRRVADPLRFGLYVR